MGRLVSESAAGVLGKPPGERLGRAHRLHRRLDFNRCYQGGRRRHGDLATVHAHANGAGACRLGITVSRKVGNAVIRHRCKRRIREIFRRWPRRSGLPPLDLVVHVKPLAGSAPFARLRDQLEGQLASLVSTR